MSYQALKLDGNGYASIADASAAGLDMGLSDFMIEARIKSPSAPGSTTYIFHKYTATVGYYVYINTSGQVGHMTRDGGGYVVGVIINTNICDGQWHHIAIVWDRSGNVRGFLDGVSQQTSNILAKNGSLDNTAAFSICQNTTYVGLIEEVRIWNFGVDGLPADYAAYIAWRAAGRNVFKDISEYDSGAWNGYADADRTNEVTDGGLEN